MLRPSWAPFVEVDAAIVAHGYACACNHRDAAAQLLLRLIARGTACMQRHMAGDRFLCIKICHVFEEVGKGEIASTKSRLKAIISLK
jgi:5,10-methenyltetrahydromethanopterin hydrogenase